MFKAKRADGRSRRQVVLDLCKTKSPHDVVTYEELGQALDLDPVADRTIIQGTVQHANQSLLKEYQRGMQVIPNTGYQVLEAREHLDAAGKHQRKSTRAQGRAVHFLKNTKLEEMTPTERQLHQGQLMIAQMVLTHHKQTAAHLKRHDQAIESLRDDVRKLGGEAKIVEGKIIDEKAIEPKNLNQEGKS
jgi:hypothetical protein